MGGRLGPGSMTAAAVTSGIGISSGDESGLGEEAGGEAMVVAIETFLECG